MKYTLWRDKMKFLKIMFVVLLLASSAVYAKDSRSKSYDLKSSSDRSVRSYTKKNGTHVVRHKKTVKNHTRQDNYTTKGNVNPYTGKKGTKKAYN